MKQRETQIDTKEEGREGERHRHGESESERGRCWQRERELGGKRKGGREACRRGMLV